MKLVLVIVTKTAGVCLTCDRYKASEDTKLKNLIKGQTNIRVVSLTASSTALGNSFEEKVYYHPQMMTVYWKWWPSFFLFTEESWNSPNEDLKGYILGGKIEYINNEPKMIEDTVDSKYSSLATDIFLWVTKKMETLSSRENVVKYNNYVDNIRLQIKRRGSF